jgi:hypothetical protein
LRPAAVLHRLARVVWASSETTLGLPFDRVQPAEAPIAEDRLALGAPTTGSEDLIIAAADTCQSRQQA